MHYRIDQVGESSSQDLRCSGWKIQQDSTPSDKSETFWADVSGKIMFFESKSRCRKQWSRNGQEQHQMLVQMFWQILSTRTENNIHQKTWAINIFIHFPLTTESHASWGFPPQILLRRVWPRLAPRGEGGGGCEGPAHPPPPSPRGAARPRNQGQTRLAYGSGCFFDCKEIPKEYLKLLTRLGEESLDEAENVQEVSWSSMCASKRSRRMWSSPSHFEGWDS